MVQRTRFIQKRIEENACNSPHFEVRLTLVSENLVKTPTSLPNLKSLVVALIVVILASVSCTRIRQLVLPNTQSDQLNEFNYSVPFGFTNSEQDDLPRSLERFLILLPDSSHIYLTDFASQPVDLQTLGERVKSYLEGKSEYERAVYLAASSSVDATTLNSVLNELRKREINSVNLLTSSTERRKDPYGNDGTYEKSMGDIPAPDRVFRVDIRSAAYGQIPGYDTKPNPLTLRVQLHPNGALDLNNEAYRDAVELASKLEEVFKARESNGVFRENSDEIEKTVLFQIDYKGSDSQNSHRYGDLVRVIDALKGAGTSPIVLTDSSTLWLEPHKPDRPILVAETTPSTGSKPPTTISGGVLNGKATSLPKPPYPPAARAVRASGAVTVQITVDENGSVIQASAVSGHPLLRSAAVQAARGARFSPTLLAGKAVKVTGVLTYNFAPPE